MKILQSLEIVTLVASLVNYGVAGDKLSDIENTVKITPLSIDFIKNGISLGTYLCIPSDGFLGQAYLFDTNKKDSVILNEEASSEKTWFKFTDIFSRTNVVLFTSKEKNQLIDSKTMRPYICSIVKASSNYQI